MEQLKAELQRANNEHDAEMSNCLRGEAERTLAKADELWAVGVKNEKLKQELAEAQAAHVQARQLHRRSEAETSLLRAALAAVETSMEAAFASSEAKLVENEKLKQELAEAQAAHEEAHKEESRVMVRVGLRLADAEAAAADAKQQVVRLNDMFASFNRHAVGLGGHTSHDLLIKRAHYKGQASAAFRSTSPRFGKWQQLAARGIGAKALGEEHPLRPGPSSHHSNRDSKGALGSVGAQSCGAGGGEGGGREGGVRDAYA